MIEQTDRIKSIKREYPQQIPVKVNILPSAWMKHRDALDAIVRRHPFLFGDQTAQRDYDSVRRQSYVAGQHVDAWGCIWSNVKTGMDAIVTGHPVPTRSKIHSLEIPQANDGMPHGFMFLRLADLRGFEEIMTDFAEEPPELQMLIDKVLLYNLRQVDIRLAKMDGRENIVYFGDDLGMQSGLPISPAKWRKYLKPCYYSLYSRVKKAGQYVYMHTDGRILEILSDLIECGVDVINPQVGANGLENLAAACKGKICIDLDLDRQMFPFWKVSDIESHVHQVVDVLGAPEGGLWLTAEIAEDVPLINVEAICASLESVSRRTAGKE